MRSLLLILFTALIVPAEDWSRFRGPNGSGYAPGPGYPTQFSKSQNVVWRTPVKRGRSSPVLTANRIFLTGFADEKLYTLCLDRQTGKVLWEQFIERPRKEFAHALNEPSSNTPVTDGENVYVFFRDFGLASYDGAGKLRWKVPLGPFGNAEGVSGSPILAGGLVILVAEQYFDGYLLALDSRTGKTRWKIARDERAGYMTPVLYEPKGGPSQIVTASDGRLSGYRVSDGKRLWTAEGVPPAIVASPIVHDGRLYVFGYGYYSAPPFSSALEKSDKNGDGKITPDEYGDSTWLYRLGMLIGNRDGVVTKEKWDFAYQRLLKPSGFVAMDLPAGGEVPVKEVWRYEKSFVGVVPSPLLHGGLLYFVKNGGIFTAMDAATGQVAKAGRLPQAPDSYYASPVVTADGRIFVVSDKGKVSVVKAGRDWEVLTVNDLEEDSYATPAFSEGKIYFRTNEAMYCFSAR